MVPLQGIWSCKGSLPSPNHQRKHHCQNTTATINNTEAPDTVTHILQGLYTKV